MKFILAIFLTGSFCVGAEIQIFIAAHDLKKTGKKDILSFSHSSDDHFFIIVKNVSERDLLLPPQFGHVNSYLFFRNSEGREWYFKNVQVANDLYPELDFTILPSGLFRVYRINFFDPGWVNIAKGEKTALTVYFDFSLERYRKVYGVRWDSPANPIELSAVKQEGPNILIEL